MDEQRNANSSIDDCIASFPIVVVQRDVRRFEHRQQLLGLVVGSAARLAG